MPLGLSVGDSIDTTTIHLDRVSLVRYAGASGDFNPIHFRDDVAASVGLPGVLAHGMLTMGFAVQPLMNFLGARGRLADYGVRFTRPIVVDPTSGADVTIETKVGAVMDDAIRFDLTVTFNGETVLGKAQAHGVDVGQQAGLVIGKQSNLRGQVTVRHAPCDLAGVAELTSQLAQYAA